MSMVRSRTEAPDIPEVGQVVRCRGQMWAVNEVLGSSQPADPLADVGRHHLVRLSSLEDDGFGDELMVIWEIEPGTEIIPRQELPRPEPGRLDPPARLGAFLDAVRWGAVATADTQALQAPFRAGITIEEYQLESGRPGIVDASGQPACCRRCWARQDDRSRPSGAGTPSAAPCAFGDRRVPSKPLH